MAPAPACTAHGRSRALGEPRAQEAGLLPQAGPPVTMPLPAAVAPDSSSGARRVEDRTARSGHARVSLPRARFPTTHAPGVSPSPGGRRADTHLLQDFPAVAGSDTNTLEHGAVDRAGVGVLEETRAASGR